MSPSQSAIAPARPIESVTASFADVIAAAVSAVMRPFTAAATTAAATRNVQIAPTAAILARPVGGASF